MSRPSSAARRIFASGPIKHRFDQLFARRLDRADQRGVRRTGWTTAVRSGLKPRASSSSDHSGALLVDFFAAAAHRPRAIFSAGATTSALPARIASPRWLMARRSSA